VVYVHPTLRVVLCFLRKLFRVCLSCLTFAEGGHIVTDIFKADTLVLRMCNFFNEWILIFFCHSYKYKQTRLPSNLKPTTHECMHLVTHDHFRSRDKHGVHTIRFAIAENSKLHANFMALCFILCNWSCCRSKFYTTGIGIFDVFCSCDLESDSMTFIYEHDPCSLEIYRMCKYELPTLRLLKVIVWQTWRKFYTRYFVGGQKGGFGINNFD